MPRVTFKSFGMKGKWKYFKPLMDISYLVGYSKSVKCALPFGIDAHS